MKKSLLVFALVLFAWPLAAQEFATEDPENPVCLLKTSMGDIHIELFAKAAPKTIENFLGLAAGTKEFTDPVSGEKVKRSYYDGLNFHRVIKGFMLQGGCPQGTGRGGPGYKFEDEINATSLGLDKIKAVENGKPHPWLMIRDQEAFQRTVLGPLIRKLGIQSQDEFQKRAEEVKAKVSALTLKGCLENQGYQFNNSLKSRKPSRGMLAMANAGPNTNGSQFFINLIDTPWLTGKHTVFGRVLTGMDIVDKIAETPVNSGDSRPLEEVKILSIQRVR